MPNITVYKDDQKFEFIAATGSNLRKALIQEGISPYTSFTKKLNCRGNGLCATCGLFIIDQPVAAAHWHDRLAKRFHYPRLSCQVTIKEDLTLLFPDKKIWGKPLKKPGIPKK